MSERDAMAAAIIAGLAEVESRRTNVEFSGPAAHQIYCDAAQFEDIIRTGQFLELWVKLNEDKLDARDILIVRDTDTLLPSGIFEVNDVDVERDDGLGVLLLRPMWIT